MQRELNLNEWLAYLETLHPRAIELGLTRVREVARRCNLLNSSCPVITVTGTNGKGSCVTFIENILLAAGYRVGAYLSPHLIHYTERVRISGNPVSDAAMCIAFAAIESVRQQTTLTYFEYGTLAALWLFQQQTLDCIILEVGMGGRLDAVNILAPDVAIITSVALDHCDWLGADRESIAYEKAGIMRCERPLIYGEPAIPQAVKAQATKLRAPLYALGHAYFYHCQDNEWTWQSDNLIWQHLPLPKLPITSAAAALMALACLQKNFQVAESAVKQGIQLAYLPGRCQVIHTQPQVILDVAHNPAAGHYLAKRLKDLPCKGKTWLVAAMLLDKDRAGTLQPLLTVADGWWFADLDGPRAGKGIDLMKCLNLAEDAKVFSSVTMALQDAMAHAASDDRIVVMGSFYTVAEVLKWHRGMSA